MNYTKELFKGTINGRISSPVFLAGELMGEKSRDKKYWWMRLKENFFDEERMDWLLEQKNGELYCVFYLKLCLKSLKNEGVLLRKIGDFYIPYDIDKIAEFTKFDRDTVIVAIQLLKQIGLISIEADGTIYMNQIDELIGISTKKADDMRLSRKNKKIEALSTKIVPKISVDTGEGATQGATNVAQSIEYRDKSIEIRNNIIVDEKKQKTEPYVNDTLLYFKNEYKKVFKQAPFLQKSECEKLLEIKEDFDRQLDCGLIEDYKDFKETIPVVLKRLKLVDFSKINFVARSSWLLQDTNYSKLMNNQFCSSNVDMESLAQRLREKEGIDSG